MSIFYLIEITKFRYKGTVLPIESCAFKAQHPRQIIEKAPFTNRGAARGSSSEPTKLTSKSSPDWNRIHISY